MSGTCKEHAQVIVDLCRCTYRTTRIAADDLLLNGDGRWYAFDEVAFGFSHSSHELACIGAETLNISALSLCVESVESQRRLTRTTHACDDDELVAGNIYADILQVVDTRTFDLY